MILASMFLLVSVLSFAASPPTDHSLKKDQSFLVEKNTVIAPAVEIVFQCTDADAANDCFKIDKATKHQMISSTAKKNESLFTPVNSIAEDYSERIQRTYELRSDQLKAYLKIRQLPGKEKNTPPDINNLE